MVEQIGDNYRLKMNNDGQKCKTIKWIKNDIKKNRWTSCCTSIDTPQQGHKVDGSELPALQMKMKYYYGWACDESVW